MKKIAPLLALAFLLGLTASPTLALSEDSRGAIYQYCGSIRQTLQSIQREDARIRVSVGAVYETIATGYLTPLNLRLVTNNIASPSLVELQASFASLRTSFSNKFVEYSRSIETLLSINCQDNPDAFYDRLVTTRNLRAELATLASDLRASATSALPIISGLKEQL